MAKQFATPLETPGKCSILPYSAFACYRARKRVCNSQPLSMLPHSAARVASSCLAILLWLALILASQKTLAAAAVESIRIVEADGKVEVMRGNSGVWDKASLESPYN